MKTLNIAHRGGAALRPENTLAAFQHAIAMGCDGAELDVKLSADGIVIVHHDFRLNPALTRKEGAWLTGETPRIKDLTFDGLRAFDLGRADPGSDYARRYPLMEPSEGTRIPTLAEVCSLSSPKPFTLLVELKSSTDPASTDPIALADAALGVTQDHLDRTIFVGFDWRGLARIKSRVPEARCWFTTDKLPGEAAPVLEIIKAAGGDGWFPWYEDVTDISVAAARVRGLQVAAWTVNEPIDMKRLLDLKLDAICTDRPDLLQTFEQCS